MFLSFAYEILKTLKAISNKKKWVSSEYRVEPESKKSNVNDISK